MIKVKALSIRDFRGIRSLDLALGCKNFAVSGPNGTGKSGVVDALEFALTKSISRLVGEGTGGLSVKEHGPHVGSDASKACVSVDVHIPHLGKDARITRYVSRPGTPTIEPDEPAIRAAFQQASDHPEIVLSRRQLIKFVIAEPSSRAKEVGSLLRLEKLELTRSLLTKISGASDRECETAAVAFSAARAGLQAALGTKDLTVAQILDAVNPRRKLLGIDELLELTPTASLRQGLDQGSRAGASVTANKVEAKENIESLRTALAALIDPTYNHVLSGINASLSALKDNAKYLEHSEQEAFLTAALDEIVDDACPVCGTGWDPDELRKVVNEKLARFEEVAVKRRAIEKALSSLHHSIDQIVGSLHSLFTMCERLDLPDLRDSIRSIAEQLKSCREKSGKLIPLEDCRAAIGEIPNGLVQLSELVEPLDAVIAALPEPSQQDAARDFLVAAQERLAMYQECRRRNAEALKKKGMANKVLAVYNATITSALTDIYEQVQGTFAALYREVNSDDESGFSAELVPSAGKLSLSVDFYGKGMFPPGAYHSEGHQDGMGLCLYLALMKHLAGEGFKLAVLDDDLMSVDAGHRRQVSAMLKKHFPETQFILTTHDAVWLKHMRTAGLVGSKAYMEFRSWNVDLGPTNFKGVDVWDEVEQYLTEGDVRAASALLRHYLEYFSAEACHSLVAKVDYKGDGQYSLGDLLPSAVSRLRELIRRGKAAADSWGQIDRADLALRFEQEVSALNAQMQLDNWQINSSVHFNRWAQLTVEDFRPIAETMRELVSKFSCESCFSTLEYSRDSESLRCACALTNINLKKKRA
ncbi:AAA family ATPase [Achromobacter kerstersii]